MKLRDEYDKPIQQRIATAAFAERMADPETWGGLTDGDGDALFAMLCHGLAMYVDAWAEAGGHEHGPAGFVLDADDTDDPSRVLDPAMALRDTLMELALDSLTFNARDILGLPNDDEGELA